MPAIFGLLAGFVVLVHLAFVAFVIAGGLLVLRWRQAAYLHLPCVAWAAYVELSGTICPLTPIENSLRTRAGLTVYSGDFIARYVFPVLYPDGLTRDIQILLGLFVVVVNLAVYGWLLATRRRSRRSPLERTATASRRAPK